MPEALVAAYLADCNHVPSIEFEDMEGEKKGDECVAREFEQNCAPDTFGCWDERQKCLDACSKPCVSCRTACASRCGDCKTACAGKADAKSCVRACAVARAGCGKACIDALEKCRGPGCEHVADNCDVAARKRRDTECGAACGEFRACVEKAQEKSVDEAGPSCEKKFPQLSEKCRQWCWPDE